MADTTFTAGTVVASTWLNDVNVHVYSAVNSRTVLKALDTTRFNVAWLNESGRSGKFIWTTGNFSTHIAADTQEGVYIKANTIASTVGAWVREVSDYTWQDSWFGIPIDGTTDCAPTISVMFNTANIGQPSIVQFGPHIYQLDSAVPIITYVNCVRGSTGPQPTIINKRYIEADADRGVFARTTHGGVFEYLSIQASGAASGGSGLSAKLPSAVANIGELTIRHCNISMTSPGANQDVVIDGTANNSGTNGYRQIFLENNKLFGGTGGASRNTYVLRSVQHCFPNGNLIQDQMTITGTSSVITDDVQGINIIAGTTALNLGTSTSDNYIQRVKLEGTIQGAVNTFGSGHTTWVRLAAVNGLVSRNWDVTTCGVENSGSSNEKFRITNLANTTDTNFGSQGKIQGLVIVTASGTGKTAIFNCLGSGNATVLLSGDSGFWSNTAGTGSRVNVFYNGSGYYGIQNNSGGTLTFSVEIIGSMVAF